MTLTFHYLSAGHYEFKTPTVTYTCNETHDSDGGYNLWLGEELLLEAMRSPEAAFAWIEAELSEGAEQ